MSCYYTYSGVVNASGTLMPDGETTVSGGCATCSGSHVVNYTWEFIVPCPSADFSQYQGSQTPSSIPIKIRGSSDSEAAGITPSEIGRGLIAWHKLDDLGSIQYDSSSNNLDATVYGDVTNVLAKSGYGKQVGSGPYSYINAPIPTQSGNQYMISFWMKPTELLTSGIEGNNFILFKSESYNGDDFDQVWDYTDAYQYRGWTEGAVGNDFVTCSAGHNGTYLLAQGASNTNWVTANYTASTLYFEIEKTKEWDIEVKFLSTHLNNNQAVGLIFTNKYTLGDHCTVLLQGVGGGSYDYSDKSPTMTSNTTPSGWAISSSNNDVIAFQVFDDVVDYDQYTSFSYTNLTGYIGSYQPNYSYRVVIFNVRTNYSGNAIRIELRSGSNFTTAVDFDYVSIVKRSGSTANGTQTPTEVTFDGGQHGCYIAKNATKWSDWITFTFDEASDYLVILDLSSMSQFPVRNSSSDSNVGAYYRSSYDSWNLQNVSGFSYSSGYDYWVQTIQVRQYTASGWDCTSSLPQSIAIDYTDYEEIINAYKWQAPYSDDRKTPRSWSFYGSTMASPDINDDDDWEILDSVGGYSDPGVGEWTETFSFTNHSIAYRHYRLKVTEVNTIGSPSYTVQIAEIELYNLDPSSSVGYVKTKTADLSYDDIIDLTMPDQFTGEIGTYLFQMVKRGDTIKFYFKDNYGSSVEKLTHEFDCSSWGNDMLIGLQSRNSSGASPSVQFDYLKFGKGQKPVDLGETTESGRLVIAYNELDNSDEITERTDSRFWGYTDYGEPAYGTATFYWDPDTWYLMQFGLDPENNEICWWVNGTKERGISIGTGSVPIQSITSLGINYFDPAMNAPSGLVILDEVSHWNRWLSAEEILKLLSKLSQAAWFYSTDYIQSSENVSDYYITLSGSYSQWDWILPYYIGYTLPGDDAHAFKVGIRQGIDSLEGHAEFDAISFRIEKTVRLHTWELEETVEKITRCSSGWIANNLGCYSCPEHAACFCDVRGNISVNLMEFNWPSTDVLMYEYFDFITFEEYITSIDPEPDSEITFRTLDIVGPQVSQSVPENNARMIHPEFLWSPNEEHSICLQEYGSDIVGYRTRVWIKHTRQGYNSYVAEDNFSFYTMDFTDIRTISNTDYLGVYFTVLPEDPGIHELLIELTAVPDESLVWNNERYSHGWKIVNFENANIFRANEDFSSKVTLDYADIVASGVYGSFTTSGIDSSLAHIQTAGIHFDPSCEVYGSQLLEISTSSGVWNTEEQTAPFAFWTIPNNPALEGWEIKTEVYATRTGDQRQQSAGLMVTTRNNPDIFYQLLLTSSGICVESHETIAFPPTQATELEWWETVLLRISKDDTLLRFHWSQDDETWNEVYPINNYDKMTPNMTSNSTPAPYSCSASSEYSTSWSPWRAFTPGNNGWHGVSGASFPQWIRFNFPTPVAILFYRLLARDDPHWDWRNFPKNFSLQGYNETEEEWETIDTRTNVYDPGQDSWYPTRGYMLVQTPKPYKSYRLYVTASNNTNVCIQEIEYIGGGEVSFDLESDLLAGPIVISDRNVFIPYKIANQTPVLTSNSAPSPYAAAASSEYTGNQGYAFRAWDNDGAYYKSWIADDGGNSSPDWVRLDYGSSNKKRIIGYRLRGTYGEGSSWAGWDPVAWQLQGSNNASDWYILDTRDFLRRAAEYYEGAWYPYPEGDYFWFTNTTYYRYYRLYVKATGTNLTYSAPYSATRAIQFIGVTEDETYEYISAEITAQFLFVKFESSYSSIDVGISDEGWELLLEGKNALSSPESSMDTRFEEISASKYYLYYSPQEDKPLLGGDQVYLRIQIEDEPSIKIDYTLTDNITLWLNAEGLPDGQIATSAFGEIEASGIYTQLDYSANNYRIYSSSNNIVISYDERWEGQAAFDKPASSNLYTPDAININVDDDNWTFHMWVYPRAALNGEIIRFKREDETDAVRIDINSSYFKYYEYDITGNNPTLIGSSGPHSFSTDEWQHVAVVKKDNFLYSFLDGRKSFYDYNGGLSTSSSSNTLLQIGESINGYLDQIIVESGTRWIGDFILNSKYDQIISYKIVDNYDLNIDFDIDIDTEAPVALPVEPYHTSSGICPASGITFDVLDDFSGVYWNSLIITIDNITVYSGGADLTEFYWDRGSLEWQTRGQEDGEWLGLNADTTRSSGINQLLYPPGTAYSGSGAWGRRFTYNVPDHTEIQYFGKRVNVHIEGNDSIGYLSQFDELIPNEFSYDYYFDMISNDNIRFGNFWLNQRESERIDILTAQGRYFFVDMWDLNYPTTDLVEEECTLTASDGVQTVTCSGIWFTTYSGMGGLTPSGVLVHRMHYNPENDYNWTGHRTIAFTVRAYNDDPLCDVYNEQTYKLVYGWEIYWHHAANKYDPFDFNKHLPVFVAAKTYEFVPSQFARSYMIWTSPGYQQDFRIFLKIPPKPYEDLGVGILAQSQYLQYSEDVTVEVECSDLDGNELIYSWTFTTEDKPQN